jgi:neutral trehalase
MGKLIAARQSWLQRQIVPSGLSEDRLRTLCKAISVMKGQVNTPEGLLTHRWTTPDRWPHRDLWLWDSVFHAIGWRHLDRGFAREMIEAVFDGQHPDGFMPHQANPRQTSSITQPPVLAFGVQMVADPISDRAWIEKLYPKLKSYIEWDLNHRIHPGVGLAAWLTDADPMSRCPESGMDNSPRFDNGADLYAVDLNAFLSHECSIMAEFTERLHLHAEAVEWKRRQRQLNQLINEHLWNDKDGFYFDFDRARQRQSGVWAVTGFLPLICGAADEKRVERLAAHLENPHTFKTAVPVRSAIMPPSARDPHDMWRGPMWINTNWLIALGFERSGRPDVALKLRRQTMHEVERWYLELGSLFEFYDEEGLLGPDHLPRKGRLERKSAYHQPIHDYGWTSTLYADLAYTVPA